MFSFTSLLGKLIVKRTVRIVTFYCWINYKSIFLSSCNRAINLSKTVISAIVIQEMFNNWDLWSQDIKNKKWLYCSQVYPREYWERNRNIALPNLCVNIIRWMRWVFFHLHYYYNFDSKCLRQPVKITMINTLQNSTLLSNKIHCQILFDINIINNNNLVMFLEESYYTHHSLGGSKNRHN